MCGFSGEGACKIPESDKVVELERGVENIVAKLSSDSTDDMDADDAEK